MASHKRWYAVLLVWGLLLAWTAAPVAAQEADAQALVQRTTDDMIRALEENRAELEAQPARVYDLVRDIALPHFDFERMSRAVLGKYWRRADAAQQERFVAAFRELLVRTYATALLEYEGQEIHYPPTRPAGDQGVTVRLEVSQQAGPPLTMSLDLYQPDGGDAWKVFNVTVEGVSLISNYRTTFSQEVQQIGVEGLIEKLERRNQGQA